MLDNAAAFISALTENEDDEATRLIYADWLEEQGQYEEAQRQRKWTAAKAWLVKLLAENRETPAHDDAYNPSFQQFCADVEEALATPRHEMMPVFSCGYNFDLMDALNANPSQFWQNWSVVTGIPVPEATVTLRGFGCC